MRRSNFADATHLFFASLGGRLGAPMMVMGYLLIAVLLLAYVSAQVYTNSLMEQVAKRKRDEIVAREKIGVLTAHYATMTSKSRVARECEDELGLVESTTNDVVRVVLHGVRAPERDSSVSMDRVLGSDITNLTRVMRQ
jgi:hypothetical protein